MNIASRLRDWVGRRESPRIAESSSGLLREFVYLDDVSVCSILASRKGGIATEFTESQTASVNTGVDGSLSVGLGATKGKLGSELRAGNVQSSQVQRKAIIQASFKELHDIEQGSLAMRHRDGICSATVDGEGQLRERFDPLVQEGWLVNTNGIHRGDLLEVKVELEADPIFRAASVITALREILEDNAQLFGNDVVAQIPQMRSMAKVLDSLLAGLVPIRGKLVDFESAMIDDREVLIHRRLLERMPLDNRPDTQSVFVVGVAERDLFWKDIRRVLFSQAEYTVFCRLATNGVVNEWRPVKVADVLAGIAPEFDEQINSFGETVSRAMTNAAHAQTTAVEQSARATTDVLRVYAERLVQHHGCTAAPDVIDEALQHIAPSQDWLSSVDGRRRAFADVTQRLDRALCVETVGDDAYDLRQEAMREAGGADARGAQVPSVSKADPAANRDEKFLDAEIIAIYW